MMRETWVDSWRGILIFQIVFFHVLGVAIQNAMGPIKPILEMVYSGIAHYHVMAFFAITGFVWIRKDTISIAEYVKNKSFRLLFPYFVWGMLCAFLFCLLLIFKCGVLAVQADMQTQLKYWHPFVSIILGNGWPNGIGYRVMNALWFLPHMFAVLLAYFVIDRYCRRGVQLFLVLPFFALYKLFAAHDIAWPFRFDWIPNSLTCLILARYALAYFFRTGMNHWNRFKYIICSAMFYAIFCFPTTINKIAEIVGLYSWSSFLRCFVAIIGSAMLAKALDCKWFGIVGNASLGILVTHKFFILAIQTFHGLAYQFFSHGNSMIVILIALIVAVTVTVLSTFATLSIRGFHLGAILGEVRLQK